MTAIFESIKKGAIENKNSTYKIISKILLDNFMKRKFLSQKELADLSFLSPSTITQYSKYMGFSGYRELVVRLKMESEKLYIKQKVSTNFKELDFTTIEQINSWIKTNEMFINKFISELHKHDEITIFASYQAITAVEYFRTMLFTLQKQINVVTPSSENYLIQRNSSNSLNVIVLCGKDTDTFNEIYLRNATNTNNTFLITADSQLSKLKTDFDNIMMINFEKDNCGYIYRNLALQLLFFTIYESL